MKAMFNFLGSWLVGNIAFACGVIFTMVLAIWLLGCSYKVEHEIGVKLELDDECLTAFPTCSGGDFYCEEADGTRAYDCEVNCLAASSRSCSTEGPVCMQLDEEVPVFCTSAE